jgi:hypothetical protein
MVSTTTKEMKLEHEMSGLKEMKKILFYSEKPGNELVSKFHMIQTTCPLPVQ